MSRAVSLYEQGHRDGYLAGLMGDDEGPAEDPQSVPALIVAECNEIRTMLLAKNRAYGNSALDPLRVFSRASTEEQIRVRLDDKLSRLKRGSGEETEDVEADIIGYLVLLRVHRRLAASAVEDRPAEARGGEP